MLARGRVGELEIEGRHALGGDRDEKAGNFTVVNLDPLFAYAVDQDDAALTGALAGGFNGGNMRDGFQLLPVPRFDERRCKLTK